MKTDKEIIKEAINLFKLKAIESIDKKDAIGALIFGGTSYVLNSCFETLSNDPMFTFQTQRKRDVIDADQLDSNDRK